jgi:hypothetical protein
LKGKSKPKLSNEDFVTLDIKAQPNYMLYIGIPLYTHTHTHKYVKSKIMENYAPRKTNHQKLGNVILIFYK